MNSTPRFGTKGLPLEPCLGIENGIRLSRLGWDTRCETWAGYGEGLVEGGQVDSSLLGQGTVCGA